MPSSKKIDGFFFCLRNFISASHIQLWWNQREFRFNGTEYCWTKVNRSTKTFLPTFFLSLSLWLHVFSLFFRCETTPLHAPCFVVWHHYRFDFMYAQNVYAKRTWAYIEHYLFYIFCKYFEWRIFFMYVCHSLESTLYYPAFYSFFFSLEKRMRKKKKYENMNVAKSISSSFAYGNTAYKEE